MGRRGACGRRKGREQREEQSMWDRAAGLSVRAHQGTAASGCACFSRINYIDHFIVPYFNFLSLRHFPSCALD